MVRRKDIPGTMGAKNVTEKIKPYNVSRDKAEKGRFMQNFVYSRASDKMTAYDDADYIAILFNSTEATRAGYFANACEEAVTRFRKTGNLKEEVSEQKAAYKALCDAWINVIMTLSAQETIIDLMANPPRSDSATSLGNGDTGNTNVALFTKSSRATLFQDLQGLLVPNVVKEVAKAFNFYWKMSDEWIRGETTIPSRYICPRIPSAALTTIQSEVNSIYSNQGEAKLHMDKFGIKYAAFSEADLKPRELKLTDPDSIAYLSHMTLAYRGLAADKKLGPTNGYQADGGEAYKWYFKDTPNESVINYLAKLCMPYEGTYNKYGGLLGWAIMTSAQNDGVMHAKFTEASEFLADTVYNNLDFLLNVRALWEQTDVINIELTGTDPTNADITIWPLALRESLRYGTGIDETRSDNILIAYLGSLTF